MITNPNFIETYQIKDLSWIDPAIDFFEKSDYKIKGRIGGPDNVEEDQKKSTDLPLYEHYFDDNIKRHIDIYLTQLQDCLKQYITKYNFVNEYQKFHVSYPINRCLVYMTYLNDVLKSGGETEWYYQKYKVKPKKGLTVIWPTDFTHTHRGIPTVEEKKYIFTGWYIYDERTNKNV